MDLNKKSSAVEHFKKCCCDEIKLTEEHEIIVKISHIIGECPSNVRIAERIFNEMKYEVARYIVLHEYKCSRKMYEVSDLDCWLDEKTSRGELEKLSEFIEKYLR